MRSTIQIGEADRFCNVAKALGERSDYLTGSVLAPDDGHFRRKRPASKLPLDFLPRPTTMMPRQHFPYKL
jgi:hypothetical protein